MFTFGQGKRLQGGCHIIWSMAISKMMRDEIVIEDKRRRIEVEKMDTAFCTAMLNAIDAGTERSPEGICKEPGTRRPIVISPN
jgi:hypothetical protein